MAMLVILKGPNAGQQFELGAESTIGRHPDARIFVDSPAVSRYHARIVSKGTSVLVQDLNSSNGTHVNGARITTEVPLTEKDTLQVGPYVFGLRHAPTPTPTERDLVIREQVSAIGSGESLLGQGASQKLKVVLDIAQHLARTLDLEQLLEKLLQLLMDLFRQADRSMVLLCDGEQLVVRGQNCRRAADPTTYLYSRTIVKKVLGEGVGILSEDIRGDTRFTEGSSLMGLELRSLMCVPLVAQDGRRLGVLQLDRFQPGHAFKMDDLQMLATIGLQVSVVLENAALHAELVREERFHQELATAREIQQGFLPVDFPKPQKVGYELYARVLPAREVAGDLYDFFSLPDGRLVFAVGDVSGKGMPAALFMVAVHTLCRHLGAAGESPADTLTKLNVALSGDNPSGMFVTLAYGIYEPATGAVILASGGHPIPLHRRADGTVEEVKMETGRLLGFDAGGLGMNNVQLTLERNETLILYTDGYNEARDRGGNTMFGVERLQQLMGGPRTQMSLEACADEAKAGLDRFTAKAELQDDLTLLLLRRV